MSLKPDRPSRPSGTPSSDSQPTEPAALSQDEIFHILQTNRRRDVISYLLDNEGSIKMGDLAEIVAAKEHETTVEALRSAQRQRVYIPLYQKHLPKLDKDGIIDYNQSRGIVRPTERLEVFRPYLDAANGRDSDDQPGPTALHSLSGGVISDYHLTAIGVSSSLLAASVSGLLSLPGQTLAAIIMLLFTLATVAVTFPAPRSSNDSGDTASTTVTYQE